MLREAHIIVDWLFVQVPCELVFDRLLIVPLGPDIVPHILTLDRHIIENVGKFKLIVHMSSVHGVLLYESIEVSGSGCIMD